MVFQYPHRYSIANNENDGGVAYLFKLRRNCCLNPELPVTLVAKTLEILVYCTFEI